jgi:hypothetical protein
LELKLGKTGGLLGTETRHDRRAALWLEISMTGGLLVAEIRHDRRAACG